MTREREGYHLTPWPVSRLSFRAGVFAIIRTALNAPVAQLDRVLGYEPRGRGFESCRARHIFKGLDESLTPFFFPSASFLEMAPTMAPTISRTVTEPGLIELNSR